MPVIYCNFAEAIKKARALKTGRIYRRLYTNQGPTKSCDWCMPLLIVMAAVSQAIVLVMITLSFRLARDAGLNIGLIQVIWSLNPFL